MSIRHEYIDELLAIVAKKTNITDWKSTYTEFASVGQNYFGTLLPISLQGKKEFDKDITIHLVLKLAPNDERYRVSGALTQFFAREIFVYSNVLNKYQELQQDYPQSLRFMIPRCYYLSNEYCREVIIMENMCLCGYKPYESGRFLDFTHITLALQSLAKFHALSFILKDMDTKNYEEVVQMCLPLTEHNNKRFMEILRDRVSKALEKLKTTKYISILEGLQQNCVELVESATTSASKTCICHGDIWKENILFQYEKNLPISACLIDYQTTRICSPAFDVLFLITTSTDEDLRHAHYNGLLQTYYYSFDEFLRQAGMDSEKMYSRQTLDSDLKVVAPACFIVANTALWLANGMQEEGHVKSKIVFTTDQEKREAEQRYKKIIMHILDDYCSYGYLSYR